MSIRNFGQNEKDSFSNFFFYPQKNKKKFQLKSISYDTSIYLQTHNLRSLASIHQSV